MEVPLGNILYVLFHGVSDCLLQHEDLLPQDIIMARKGPESRHGFVNLKDRDSPFTGELQESGSVLLLVAADALLGMISTLVFGVVLELVVLLSAFVFQTLALSSALFVTSASASVTCLHMNNANFLFIGTGIHLCEQQHSEC